MSNKLQFLAKYGHSGHIDKIINDDGDADSFHTAHKLATENPVYDEHHITKSLDSEHMGVRKLAALHPKINDSHVAKIMKDDSYNSASIKSAVMINDNIKPHAIKAAFDNGNAETRKIIGKHTFLPAELRHHVLQNTSDPEIYDHITRRIKADKKLDDFYDSIKDHPLLNSK